MKRIGNEIYIQRGETWSLDFDVVNERGAPLMLLNAWENPYLAITIAAGLYEQKGDFRRTYWLDLSKRWVEQVDGSVVLEPMKRFISTEALPISTFSVEEVLTYYGPANGGKIVADKSSDFDVTNYLFFTDPYSDGNYVYKYVKDYELQNGIPVVEVWEEYNFRIIKQFSTKDWMEQGYLFDIKILAGESVQEHIARILNITVEDAWTDEETRNYIAQITDSTKRAEMQEIFDSRVPLMPTYDIKNLILQPTKLYVSANIQGGVR